MQLSDLEQSTARPKDTYSVENPVYEADNAEAAQGKKEEVKSDSAAISEPREEFDQFTDDQGMENPVYGFMLDAEEQDDDFKGRLELKNPGDDSGSPMRKEQYKGTLDLDNPFVEVDI